MRLLRAVKFYCSTTFTWRTSWKVASGPRFRVVPRDGFLYVEPR
jgi:hypothetical protein